MIPEALSRHKMALDAGIMYAFGAALLFSFKPVLVKMIYVYPLDSVTLLAWRMLISLPIYLAIGLFLHLRHRQSGRRLDRRWMGKALLIGLLGYYLAALFDLLGLQTITAQLERLILFSYPTWVAMLTWLLLKKPLEPKILVALGLSYIGIAVIFVSDWQQLGNNVVIGTLWVLAAALAFSLYVVLSKPIIDAIGAREFTVLAMVSSSLITLLHFFLVKTPQDLVISLPAFKLVLVMAGLTTVLPTFLLAAAISRLGPSKTAITGTLGPAMTSLFAVIFLDEYFGWPQFVGLALVIAAIRIMQHKPRETV